MVIQQKTGRPVQFEITADVRASLLAWLERRGGTIEDYAFPSRVDHADHLSARQYARLVDEWVTAIGLRREDYGNTVRYLGVDIEDALESAEHLRFDIVRPRSERGRASV
jgi:hypothetical protein